MNQEQVKSHSAIPLFRQQALEHITNRKYGTVLLATPLSHRFLTLLFVAIAAAIIPDEQHPVEVRLGFDAPQQFGQIRFALAGGQQDIDAGRGHNLHYNGLSQ